MHKPFSIRGLVAIMALGLAFGIAVILTLKEPAPPDDVIAGDTRIAIAALGDSDAHSYHDSLQINKDWQRGGEFRSTTFQWTEILARLRPNEVDLGPWGKWGQRAKIGLALSMFGLENRSPRKQDFRYNFAISGDECFKLIDGPYRQTQRLVWLMDQAPRRWERGVVVIRIGVNSLGKKTGLDRYARTGLDARALAEVSQCADAVRRSISLIRGHHSRTAIVVADNQDYLESLLALGHWKDLAPRENVIEVQKKFDDLLREIVATDPHATLIIDREWFANYWGLIENTSPPRFRSVNLGGKYNVELSAGDHPRNAWVKDGHAGSVNSGLWAKDFVSLLESRFGIEITPISESEIARIADPEGKFGI